MYLNSRIERNLFSQEIKTGIEDVQLPNEHDISVLSVVGQASIEARKARKQSLLKRKRLLCRFQIKDQYIYVYIFFLNSVNHYKMI